MTRIQPKQSAALILALLVACAAPATMRTLDVEGGQLRVEGLPRCGAFDTAALAALGAEDVAWTFRDRPHVYSGVPLDRLLVHCGFTEGAGGPTVPAAEKRPGWRQVVLARARDGFVAVFTCAELMPAMGPTRAYVVWAVDGAPLDEAEGPLRLVVVTDQKGSRSVRQLRELSIVDVRLATAVGR